MSIKLPSPPVPMHGFFTALHKGYIVPITETDLRARDLGVARCVLEAAAQAAELWHANGIEVEIAREIRALEFKHAE